MSEEYLIRHCAPTLAGLKTGSMFSCPFDSKATLLEALRKLNKRLGAKGLRLLPIRISDKKALIYLFRPGNLSADLSHATAAQILQRHGYDTANCDKCVVQLVKRLRQQQEFPHEIGLFLGYPPEDVCGFIENKACNCKCTGCWKVYGDAAAAQKKFAQYKKCTRVYCELWAKGKDIERLAVATKAG